MRKKHKISGLSPRTLVFLETTVFVLVLLIFGVKLTNYFGVESLQPARLVDIVKSTVGDTAEKISQSKLIGTCREGQLKIDVDWSYVCRSNTEINKYVTIFDTYDKLPGGRESIYANAGNGAIDRAKLLVEENKYDFGRYEPSEISDNNWQEDPYDDRYWRFNYYGLSMVDDLVYAYDKTGDKKYADKATKIVESFLKDGTAEVHAWDDSHAVSFRAMTLVNYWWKLRQGDALDIQTSNRVLIAIEKHSEFLADRAHFEPHHNHGVNEAAALLLMSSAFPTLNNSSEYQKLAIDRVDTTLNNLIDSDGALIENSPYYHFYVLSKYWGIYKYSTKQNISMTSTLKDKLDDMAHYATNIIQPDLHIPTIGSSLNKQVFYSSEYVDIASEYPELKYVITQGKWGDKPNKVNNYYESTGQAILRNSFDGNFSNHLQLMFQASGFRTNHSHLDALSFVLTKGDTPILIDPGLYSYEVNDISSFMRGTSAHNTVSVDGRSQKEGDAQVVDFSESKNYSSATGNHELYDGVTHDRTVSMLNDSTVVVIDRMSSKDEHTYKQHFHFATGSSTKIIDNSNLEVTLKDDKKIKVKQLKPIDKAELIVNQQNGSVGGICSQEYKKILTCEQVDFSKIGSQIEFITVFELDSSKRDYSLGADKLSVKIGDYDQFNINMKKVPAQERIVKSEAKTELPAFNCTPIENQPDLDLWAVDDGKLTSMDSHYSFVPGRQVTAVAKRDVKLNLEDKSIAIRMRVRDIQFLKGLDLRLSNNRWSSTMSHSLSITYSPDLDGDWITINLGASLARADNNAQWDLRNGDSFDWANIDGIMLVATGSQDGSPIIDYFSPCTAPIPSKGNIAFVIDDGNQTIDYAIPVFEKYNHKASIAAIGKYLDHHQAGFLTPNELTKIHERYEWDIVNHSYGHVAAVPTYIDKGMSAEYEEDVLKGSIALHKYGLDTNTNWFIYPLGSYNGATIDILDKYYRFARGQSRGPEVSPFAEPLAVKAFPVQDDTSVASIEAAIDNALAGNHTLLLTLHRFKKSNNPNEVGYQISNLDIILKYLSDKKIQAKSLTELDQSLGLDQLKTEYQEYIPGYTKITADYTSTKPWYYIIP